MLAILQSRDNNKSTFINKARMMIPIKLIYNDLKEVSAEEALSDYKEELIAILVNSELTMKQHDEIHSLFFSLFVSVMRSKPLCHIENVMCSDLIVCISMIYACTPDECYDISKQYYSGLQKIVSKAYKKLMLSAAIVEAIYDDVTINTIFFIAVLNNNDSCEAYKKDLLQIAEVLLEGAADVE